MLASRRIRLRTKYLLKSSISAGYAKIAKIAYLAEYQQVRDCAPAAPRNSLMLNNLGGRMHELAKTEEFSPQRVKKLYFLSY